MYYNPYSATDGFKDELLVGQKMPGSENYGYDALAKYTVSGEEALEKSTEVAKAEGKGMFERPLSRETEADKNGDKRRLDRKLSRTLYLLVKGKEEKGIMYGEEGLTTGKDGWMFPASNVTGKESVKQVCVVGGCHG